MTRHLDVDGRLVEGRPRVENIESYVRACQALGYQGLDTAEVGNWYASEDGLNLRALDADCAALQAAAAAAENVLRTQDSQLTALASAWTGHGAEASREFLRGHSVASAQTANSLRAAADALAALRDDLWRMVDGKVATTEAVDDRTAGVRAAWLAAAHTVTTGAGDQAVASELVDQQVKPFVDNDIYEWLTAMRVATAAITDALDAAAAALSAEPTVVFEVPGELGPSWTPSPSVDKDDDAAPASAPPAAAGWIAPAAWSAPTPPMPGAAPMPAAPDAPPAPPTPPSALPVEPAAMTPPAPVPAMPAMPSLGDPGGAMSGLAGFGQQLADAIGGLLQSPEDTLTDAEDLDEPVDEELENDEPLEDSADDDEPVAEELECEGVAADAPPAEDPPPEPEPLPTGEVPIPDPAPTPAPIPAEPLPAEPPAPLSADAGETPCEIAADELPQAGE